MSVTGAVASSSKELAKFGAGIITAYTLHEVGHVVAGCATGTDLDWGIGTYNQPLGFEEHDDKGHSGAIVNASGLLTQLLVSDYILSTDSVDLRDSYTRGVMAWNIINPILYALDYWVIRRTNRIEGGRGGEYRGDLAGVEYHLGRDWGNGLSAFVSVMAIYQGCEFVKRQGWKGGEGEEEQTSLHGKGLDWGCNMVPVRGGGMVAVTVNF